MHAIVQRPELLAKIYRHAPTQVTVEKLQALVRAGTPSLLTVAALPTECLKNSSGATVGFINVAANLARLVAAIHKTGFIIGDVNHGNILVRNDGTVAAIDCDSFQIGDGSRFPCGVGVEFFTPPELLGRNLASIRRTANHDARLSDALSPLMQIAALEAR